MTMQAINRPLWWPFEMTANVTTAFASPTSLTANGMAIDLIGHFHHKSYGNSRSIVGAEFRWGTATAGTAQTVTVGIQGVTGASAGPARGDGTYKNAGNAKKAVTTGYAAAAAWETAFAAFDASYGVSYGEKICVRLEISGITGSPNFTPSCVRNLFAPDPAGHMPQVTFFNGTATYTAQTIGLPNVALKMDDGSYGFLLCGGAFSAITATGNFQDSSNPDEYGNLINLAYPLDACAVYGKIITNSANADGRMGIWSSPLSGTTAAMTGWPVAFDGTEGGNTASERGILIGGPKVSLATSTNYVYSVGAEGGTANINTTYVDFNAAQIQQDFFGTNVYAVSRQGDTASTNFAAFGTFRVMLLSILMCGAADDAAGAGGGGLRLAGTGGLAA